MKPDVVWLNIAVNDVIPMRFRKGSDYLSCDVQGFRFRHRTPTNSLHERFALNKLHNNVRATVVVLANIVNLGNIWMAQSSLTLRLTHKAVDGLRFIYQMSVHELDGDSTPQALVTRTIDDTHAAMANFFTQFVAHAGYGRRTSMT